MFWFMVGMVVGFLVGLLVGRKNPDVADKAAAAANAVKNKAEDVVKGG